MNITICKNLKELRKQKGNTQEELAEHLGISMQAVSKWERGEGYPDITLIPAIALYYNVTTDKLFGIDEIGVEAKIEEYLARATEVYSQTATGDEDEKHIKKIAIWREAAKEFPNNHKVLSTLLEFLVYPIRNAHNHFEEIVKIGEKLFAESTDNVIRSNTIRMLSEFYAEQKDFETAKKYANMLPSYWHSKEIIYARYLPDEERIAYRQKNIREFIENAIHLTFVIDILGCDIAIEEKIKVYEFVYKLYHLLYEDGDFGYSEIMMGDTCYTLATSHLSVCNHDEALRYLGEMADHKIKADQHLSMQDYSQFKHTSFMVNRLSTPLARSGNSLAKDTVRIAVANDIKQIEEAKSFDNVRNDERYIAAIEKMKSLL